MGREFQTEGTAGVKALLQRGLGMFKEQLGGLWSPSSIRGKTVGGEVRGIVEPRPVLGLRGPLEGSEQRNDRI